MIQLIAAVDWEALLTRGTPLGAVFVFLYGVWKYNKAQQWKRAEFLAREMKEFNNKQSTQIVKTLLDWINPEIQLPDDTGILKPTRVTDDELPTALRIPIAGSDHFDQKEFALRGIFDEYLDNLDRFGHYIEADLIAPGDFKPYLDYWLKIISGNRKVGGGLDKPQEYLDAISKYIRHYSWSGAILLFEQSGYPLSMRAEPTKDSIAGSAKENGRSKGDATR